MYALGRGCIPYRAMHVMRTASGRCKGTCDEEQWILLYTMTWVCFNQWFWSTVNRSSLGSSRNIETECALPDTKSDGHWFDLVWTYASRLFSKTLFSSPAWDHRRWLHRTAPTRHHRGAWRSVARSRSSIRRPPHAEMQRVHFSSVLLTRSESEFRFVAAKRDRAGCPPRTIRIANCIDAPAVQSTQRSMIFERIISVKYYRTVVTIIGGAGTSSRNIFARHPATTAKLIYR